MYSTMAQLSNGIMCMSQTPHKQQHMHQYTGKHHAGPHSAEFTSSFHVVAPSCMGWLVLHVLYILCMRVQGTMYGYHVWAMVPEAHAQRTSQAASELCFQCIQSFLALWLDGCCFMFFTHTSCWATMGSNPPSTPLSCLLLCGA